MNKRFSMVTAITALLVSFCISFTVYAVSNDDEPNLPNFPSTPNEPHYEPPKLEPISEQVLTFAPGEAREINVKIKNIGDYAASDVWVRVSADVDAPISVELGRNSERFGAVYRNAERDIKLNVRVSLTAKAKSYPVVLRFTYRERNNKMIEDKITVYIKVEDEAVEPELIVRDFTAGGGVNAGDNFTLAAILHNVGMAEAKDIQVMVKGFEPTGVYLSGESNNKYYNTLLAGAIQNMSFSLSTHKDIKSGSYPLTFMIKYRDKNNETKENEYIYYVNVKSAVSSRQRSNLEILRFSGPTGVHNVDQLFTCSFDIANTGSQTAKNIKVEAVTDEFIRPRSANRISLKELLPGASSSLSFSFAATSKAETQSYVIGFKVTYESGLQSDEKPEIETFEQFIGVNVYNPEKKDKDEKDEKDKKIRIPRIIIDSYTVTPIIVSAGQDFDISMVFRNTHLSTSIENIKVVLTPLEPTENSSSPFMPVNGSNTFYISHISPGGTAAKSFRMYAIPNADPRAYTIRVDFDYQDAEFNEYKANEIIGVTIKQTTKLDTGNIMTPDEGFMNQPIFISFSLMNTGKSTLNNLTVEIQGDGFDVSKSFMYFGSLNKSGSSYYDAEIVPQMPGRLDGKVIISYEDDTGEVTKTERKFTVNVMDMPMYDGISGDLQVDLQSDRFGGGRMGGVGLIGKITGFVSNPLVWVGVVALGIAAFLGKRFYDRQRRPKYDE